MAQLGQGLALDLPDPLAGEVEVLADVVEGARLAVDQAVAHLHDAALAVGEAGQHRAQLLAHEQERRRLPGHDRVLVLDEVTEARVAVLADEGVEAGGVTVVGPDLLDPLGREVDLDRDLGGGGLAAQLHHQVALDAADLVDLLDHVHGQADGARLVGHRAGEGLPDPPGGVRRELEALGVVELLDRADQPEVALLDEVGQTHPATGVLLGDADDQAQVGLEHVLLGLLALPDDVLQVGLELRGDLAALRESLRGEQAGLHGTGELDLHLGGQQRHPADLVEVEPQDVDAQGGAGLDLLLLLLLGLGRELLGSGLLGRHLGDVDARCALDDSPDESPRRVDGRLHRSSGLGRGLLGGGLGACLVGRCALSVGAFLAGAFLAAPSWRAASRPGPRSRRRPRTSSRGCGWPAAAQGRQRSCSEGLLEGGRVRRVRVLPMIVAPLRVGRGHRRGVCGPTRWGRTREPDPTDPWSAHV